MSEKGLIEFVELLDSSREKLTENPIQIETEKNNMPVEIALHYNTSFSENVHSYVNNINTIEGGTHLAGFRRGLTRTLKNYAEKSGMLAKLKFDISGDDFREGLTAIISVKVQEPQFEGQTKTKLGNSEVMGAVDQAISSELSNYLEENPKELHKDLVVSALNIGFQILSTKTTMNQVDQLEKVSEDFIEEFDKKLDALEDTMIEYLGEDEDQLNNFHNSAMAYVRRMARVLTVFRRQETSVDLRIVPLLQDLAQEAKEANPGLDMEGGTCSGTWWREKISRWKSGEPKARGLMTL